MTWHAPVEAMDSLTRERIAQFGEDLRAEKAKLHRLASAGSRFVVRRCQAELGSNHLRLFRHDDLMAVTEQDKGPAILSGNDFTHQRRVYTDPSPVLRT
jgi:hypothetical protein